MGGSTEYLDKGDYNPEKSSRIRRHWVSLSVLTFVYVVGELSHFLLGIVTTPMSQEIQYGDMGCLTSDKFVHQADVEDAQCFQAENNMSCLTIGEISGTNESACTWNYSGLGIQYQILAGPAFVAVFTISGVFIAILSDRYNRHIIIAVCLAILTIATTLMGAANSYWQLIILRMAIGAGESAFSPACSSMIADMIPQARRGFALGVFNWGIYFGYGLSYAVGNFVTKADILGMGWRWSYYTSGIFGFVVLIFLIVIVKEPHRRIDVVDVMPEDIDITISESEKKKSKTSFFKSFNGESGLTLIFHTFFRMSMIMLMIAASVRHTAGFTWAYNTQLYFSTYYPSYNLGIWITAISIVGGTIGVAVGGFVSDKLVKRLGLRARVYVLAGSQLIATPFALGVLYLSPPYAFYSLLGSYIFAEMWFGVLFAVLLELVPSGIRSTTLAIFLFVMNNIGGNAPVVIEPLRKSLSYRNALVIMYPGFYFLSAVLFLVASLFVSKSTNDHQGQQRQQNKS